MKISKNEFDGVNPPLERIHDIGDQPMERALLGRCRETESMVVDAIADRLANARGIRGENVRRIQTGLSHVHRPTMADAPVIDDGLRAETSWPNGTTETADTVMGQIAGGDPK